eukprot:13974907-Ditylum_brightwellii.AAC.1
MHRLEGKRATHLTDATCYLFVLLHQKGQGTANIASANLFGPSMSKYEKHQKGTNKIDSREHNTYLLSVIPTDATNSISVSLPIGPIYFPTML